MSTRITGVKVDVEGVLSVIEIDGTTVHARLQGLYELIDCRLVDVVGLGDSIDLWVDDEGLYTAAPNPVLTGMARVTAPLTTHLSGAGVFLAHNDDGDTVSLTRDQIAAVVGWWQHGTRAVSAALATA